MEKKFLKGEIVWAKVRGFPWWPAIVRSINCSIRHEQAEGEAGDSRESQPNESAFTAVVYFVGDDSHSELPLNKIEKFQQNLEEYSKTKKKTLLNSIHIAKKIIAGEIPFDKHMHYARKKNMNFTEEQFERKSNNRKSLSVYREIENNKEIIGRERNENKEDNLLGKKRRLIRKAAENEDENDNSNVSLSDSHYFNSPARTSTPELKFTHAFNNSASSSANFSNSILNTNYTNPSANFNKTNPLGGVKANITKTSNFNSNITSINSITCPNNINVTNGNSFNGNKVTGNGNTHHQIDFRVKDDLSNNININININVNNTNNNMNINTFGRNPKKKIIDDFEDEIYASKSEKEKTAKFNTENGGSSIATNCIEKAGKTSLITNILDESCASRTLSDEERESSLHEDPYEVRTSKQEMKEAVDSLLFYKIDMPASSSNRSIISSLNLIEETLPKLKNCGIYTLLRNLIPILTSFLSSKNSAISTKSSELISLIKEKVLSEIFELENVEEDLRELFSTRIPDRIDDEYKQKLFMDVKRLDGIYYQLHRRKEKDDEKCNALNSHNEMMDNRFRRNTRKLSSLNDDFLCSDFFHRSLSRETNDCSLSLKKDNNSSNLSKNKKELGVEEKYEEKGRKVLQPLLPHMQTLNPILPIQHTNQAYREFNANVNNHSCSTVKSSKNKFSNNKNSIKPKEDDDLNLSSDSNKNISSKNISSNSVNKKKLPQLDSFQMKLLFKDFIEDNIQNINAESEIDSLNDFKEQLKHGVYCENFYQNVYCKYNGLSQSHANKRKHVCLKLLNILKLIMPQIEIDTLKKTIIFIEYSIRTKDPTLGNIYRKNFENFYERIKEILSLTTESLNLNINVQNLEQTYSH